MNEIAENPSKPDIDQDAVYKRLLKGLTLMTVGVIGGLLVDVVWIVFWRLPAPLIPEESITKFVLLSSASLLGTAATIVVVVGIVQYRSEIRDKLTRTLLLWSVIVTVAWPTFRMMSGMGRVAAFETGLPVDVLVPVLKNFPKIVHIVALVLFPLAVVRVAKNLQVHVSFAALGLVVVDPLVRLLFFLTVSFGFQWPSSFSLFLTVLAVSTKIFYATGMTWMFVDQRRAVKMKPFSRRLP